MSIEILKLPSGAMPHFRALLRVFSEAFHWPASHAATDEQLSRMLCSPHFFALVAMRGGQVLGGLTVHVLERYDGPGPAAYVYDVAVLPAYQRQGIGKALMAHLLQYCADNDFSEAFVQAERGDKEALAFYRSTALNSELGAAHFTYTFGGGA